MWGLQVIVTKTNKTVTQKSESNQAEEWILIE